MISKDQQNTAVYIIMDIISNTMMLFVGVSLLLLILSAIFVIHNLNFQQEQARSKIPAIPLIFAGSVFLILCVIGIVSYYQNDLSRNWIYLSIASFDLIVGISLLYSLGKFLSMIAGIPHLKEFEGKQMVLYFVRLFCISFLFALLLSICKF